MDYDHSSDRDLITVAIELLVVDVGPGSDMEVCTARILLLTEWFMNLHLTCSRQILRSKSSLYSVDIIVSPSLR